MNRHDFEAQFDRVYYYALAYSRLHDKALAEDVVQDAFLKAFQDVERFVPNGATVSTWVARIVINLCMDVKRAERRRDCVSLDARSNSDAQSEAWVDSFEAPTLRTHPLTTQIRAAISELPYIYREALVLRYVLDLSYDEMALRMRETVENLKVRVCRASSMLRELLPEMRG